MWTTHSRLWVLVVCIRVCQQQRRSQPRELQRQSTFDKNCAWGVPICCNNPDSRAGRLSADHPRKLQHQEPPEPSPAGCDHGISQPTMRMHIRMITTTTTASINCTVTSYGLRLAIGPLLHRSLGSSRRGRRGPRPWLFRCVGQAHATETIAECIGGGGIREAEANIGLLALVSAPAAPDRDAPLTAKRIKV
jgi:hypothetical protein